MKGSSVSSCKLSFNWLWVLLIISFSFMFLYSFPIIRPINSGVVAVILSPLLLLFHSSAISFFLKLIQHKVFISSLVIYLSSIVLAASVSVFKGTYDFTLIPTLVNNLASIICSLIIAIVLYLKARMFDISKLFVYLLVCQSIIILLMLINPDVRDSIQSLTMTDSLEKRMAAAYNNVRGMGLSGSVAFGLSVPMGTLGFFMHYWFAFRAKKLSSLLKILLLIVTFIASISAGRTAVLGFVLGFIFYLHAYKPLQLFKLSVKYIILSALFIVSGLIYILSDPELSEVAYFYSRYAFQFVYSYLSGDGFHISSLEGLYNMYFVPPNENWWFGDAKYTASDGNYYMDTDAGYMRFLLFFGILGSLLMYLGYIWIVLRVYFSIKGKVVAPGLTLVGILFMGGVFHYKGEVILFNVGFTKIFFLYCFYQIMHVAYINCNGNRTYAQKKE